MTEVLYEMSKKGLGVTGVVDSNNRLVGVLTDGDLRRILSRDKHLLDGTAADCMVPGGRMIRPQALAPEALKALEDHRITSLFVCDEERRLVGVVHLHDLWRLELF
jgi:arabinose-5-phosphate isomerase